MHIYATVSNFVLSYKLPKLIKNMKKYLIVFYFLEQICCQKKNVIRLFKLVLNKNFSKWKYNTNLAVTIQGLLYLTHRWQIISGKNCKLH